MNMGPEKPLLTTLLTPSQVAQSLGVSRSWLYEAAKTGRIPCVRIGGHDGPLRFIPDDIEQWIEDARTGYLSPAHKTSTAPRKKSKPRRSTPRTVQLSLADIAAWKPATATRRRG
jgi:excisionase family DNA binding protein